MAYTKTTWTNGVTPINETNLNKIENQLETLSRTGYFNGTTTSINSLTSDGKWRGYISQNSDDANYLGWYGNTLVETINQQDSNACIQRLTQYLTGRQKIRYRADNQFSYNDDLFEYYVKKNGDTMTGDLNIGNSSKTSNSAVYVENSYAKGNLVANTGGNVGIWNNNANKWIIYMGTNGTGACNVNAVSATKATQDGDGNNIVNTYLKKKNVVSDNVSITPSAANTPTSKAVTWSAMDGTPVVVTSANTSVPGTSVTGTGSTSISSTGATIWLTRNNTNNTTVNYIAIYK